MSYEALVAVIVLLIGAHYSSLIYRLHKAEGELADMRKEFANSAIQVANASVIAAQAIAAAATAALTAATMK